MRVLGIVPSSTDLKWALLDGTRAKPVLLPLPFISQKLPADQSEGHALLSLRRLLATFMSEQMIKRICVLQAGHAQFGRQSTTRVKAEAIIQLVAAESNRPVTLVAPQSLTAQAKHFPATTSASPEDILNGGLPFKPKILERAALLAWCGLDE